MKKSKTLGLWILTLIVLSIFVSGEKITLNTPETENAADAILYSAAPSTNYGNVGFMHVAAVGRVIVLRWNISQLYNDSAENIQDAVLGLYMSEDSLASGESISVGTHHLYDTYNWTEDAVTWNTRPGMSNYNNTIESSQIFSYLPTAGYYTWNVTKMLKTQFLDNVEILNIYINASPVSGSPGLYSYLSFGTKESSEEFRPYMNITYTINNGSIPPSVSITSFTNTTQTNQTITFGWSCTGNCTRHELFCSSVLRYNGTATTYQVTGLTPNTGYFCEIYSRYNSTIYDNANGTYYTKSNTQSGSGSYSITLVHVSPSNTANDTNTNWTGTATISGSNHKYNTTWYNTSGKEPVLVMDFNIQNAKDNSGYMNNGTVTGATYRSTGGNDGSGAYNYTSSSTYITIADDISLDLSDDFTVELWFKAAGTGFRNLLSKDNSGSEQNLNYFLGVNDDHNVWAMIGDGSTFDVIVDTVSVNDNAFHHAVLRHKNGNMSLYVDGVRHSASQTVTTPYTNAAPLLIGKWGGAGFNGIIDSVKIYNYALSDKQVNNNYNKNQKLSYLETENGESWNYNIVASNGSTYAKSSYKFLIQGNQTENGNISLIYDSAGNLIQDNEHYYEYNPFNQLYQVREEDSNGRIVERYYYDENGQRAVKVHYFVGGTNETTYYIGKDFLRVVNASGSFDTVYYFDSKNLVAEKKPNGQFIYYHPDHLGSSSLITNSSGGVVEKTTYEPYGSVFSGGTRSRYDYTGKESDQTGLQYYGARYRNPDIIVWTQPDSNIPNIYNPQALNRYSYVYNNPYKYTDPDGHNPLLYVPGVLFGAVLLGPTGAAFFAGQEYYSQSNELVETQGVSRSEARQIILNDPNRQAKIDTAAGEGFKYGVGQGILEAGVSQLGIALDSSKSLDKSNFQKTYQTYIKENADGETYVGRTSGTGTPLENVKNRDYGHHMNQEGFGPAILVDSSSNRVAIRGQEQILIDIYGGAKFVGGSSGNRINAISPDNVNKMMYIEEAMKEFWKQND